MDADENDKKDDAGTATTEVTTSTTTTTVDLQLNHSDDPSPEDNLRRILPYDDHTWIAWGGDTGALSLITKTDDDDTMMTTVTPIHRHWDADDDVRAVALHQHATDGPSSSCSLAMGFESGAVLVYRNWSPTCTTMESTNIIHGPLQEASIRDLVWINNNNSDTTTTSTTLLLLIASEAGACGWELHHGNTTRTTTVWRDAVAEHHNRNGIRSLTYNNNATNTVVVSLDFSGYACWWTLLPKNDGSSSSSSLSFVRKDTHACVTQPDRGELLGADPWDRACRVTLTDNDNSTVLPGEAWVQVRSQEGTAHDAVEQAGYHTQAIVASAVRGQGLVTIGRDKRVVLWRLEKVR